MEKYHIRSWIIFPLMGLMIITPAATHPALNAAIMLLAIGAVPSWKTIKGKRTMAIFLYGVKIICILMALGYHTQKLIADPGFQRSPAKSLERFFANR